MMRSILIGTLIGTLGIGGAAIAQDAFTPRPVQGLGADTGFTPGASDFAAPGSRAVPGVPGAANKRGPAGGVGPPAKKGRNTWPEEVPARVKTMHHEIVEELDLTPQQSKALQGLMIEKSNEFKARQAKRRAGKGKGAKAGGKGPMAGQGAAPGKRPTPPNAANGERPTPPRSLSNSGF